MIAWSSISHSWNMFGSAQVGQSTAFFWGEDGSTEVHQSQMLYGGHGGSPCRIPTTTNILEENISSSIGWINNWNNNIQMYRIRGHVYALNIIQSGYKGRNTSHKQNIRVCNHTEVVTFLRQNLSRNFSTVINNGSQIKFIGKDIDLIIDKTGRYFTNLGIPRTMRLQQFIILILTSTSRGNRPGSPYIIIFGVKDLYFKAILPNLQCRLSRHSVPFI